MIRAAFSSAVVTAAFLAPVAAQAAGEGVHPWDRYGRRPEDQQTQARRRASSRLTDPYFRRTETHALHPYYRNTYHTFLSSGRGLSRTDSARQQFLNGFPYFRVPSAAWCRNYSYYQPNYRVPPGDFRCIRH